MTITSQTTDDELFQILQEYGVRFPEKMDYVYYRPDKDWEEKIHDSNYPDSDYPGDRVTAAIYEIAVRFMVRMWATRLANP